MVNKTDFSLVTLNNFTFSFLNEIIENPKLYTDKTIELSKRMINSRK